jgi:integrase/recombinase XerD
MLEPQISVTEDTFTLDADNLIGVFTNFLQFDVANGAASPETIRTYWCQVQQYLRWCQTSRVKPTSATRDTIKIYRYALVQQGHKPKTIAIKLAAISRFYDAGMEYGLLHTNPVWGIKPPQQYDDPTEAITYFDQAETTALLQAPLTQPDPIRRHRDQLLLGIMALEGARTRELHLCNLGNIIRTGAGVGLSVASKKRRRTIPLLPELAELLAEYLKCRQTAGYSLELNGPLFVNLRRPERGECRLSLRGIRYIVDSYLIRLNLKSGNGQNRSAHSLRHTAGTLALQNGASLREVQDLLGHADPRTTAIYTNVGNKWLTNPALKLGIKLSPDPLPEG